MVALKNKLVPKPSSSEEAVLFEETIRLAVKNIHFETGDDQLSILSQLLKTHITNEIAVKRPVLRAMRDHVLVTLSAAAAEADVEADMDYDIDGEHEDVDDAQDVVSGENENNNNEKDHNDDQTKTDNDSIATTATTTGTTTNAEKKYDENEEQHSDSDSTSLPHGPSSTSATGGSGSGSGSGTLSDLRGVMLQALDQFIAVHVIGARSKASAFFDKFVRETRWLRIALVAGSSVAEDGFLAVNPWGVKTPKTLTVIDVGDGCPGREVAKRLAWQTQARVRYAPLCAAYKALENVDVVVMGAEEVLMNGCVVVAPGAAAIAHAAHEAEVPVVIMTQAVKITDRYSVDWFGLGGDILKPREVQAIITELDTNSWRPSYVPDILKKMAGDRV